MTTTTAPDTITDRQRWLALYVLCAGALMIVLDATIVNVALPTIQDDLDVSQGNLAWIVNAYLIPFGGLLLLSGRLGDLLGRRRVFESGLVLFIVASLLCGAAQSTEMLIAARFLQGVAGALTSAVILGMVVTLFPEPREQAKALGVYGFVASSGASIGLLAGGALTDLISWHWIFFVNVPIGVATVIATRRLVTDDQGLGLKAGADVPGAVLVTSGLMLAVYAILEAGESGWGSWQPLVLGPVAIALVAGFVVRQARIATPLMPLRVLKAPNVGAANIVTALLIAGMFAVFFLGALYLQGILGYSPLEVGLAFLPSTIVMATLSLRFSERAIMRFGPRALLFPSFGFIAAGLVLFSFTPVDGDYVTHVLPAMILFGIGNGLCFPALMTLAMSGATPEDSGLASGIVNMTVQAGGAIGLALLSTVAEARTDALGGDTLDAALNGGYHLAYLIGAGLVLLGTVLVAVLVKPVTAPGHGAHGEAGLSPQPAAAG